MLLIQQKRQQYHHKQQKRPLLLLKQVQITSKLCDKFGGTYILTVHDKYENLIEISRLVR